MKGFLFDQNLPSRISFQTSLPVHHVSEIGPNPTDTEVWNHGRKHELVLVSKDADFFHRIISSQPPPWIVHLKIGNMRRADFHRFLAGVWPKIETLIKNHKLIAVYQDRIEAIS